jgi:hypothetical protein
LLNVPVQLANKMGFNQKKPIWTYGIQLWGTASTSNIEILERFQSKALRMIVDALGMYRIPLSEGISKYQQLKKKSAATTMEISLREWNLPLNVYETAVSDIVTNLCTSLVLLVFLSNMSRRLCQRYSIPFFRSSTTRCNLSSALYPPSCCVPLAVFPYSCELHAMAGSRL